MLLYIWTSDIMKHPDIKLDLGLIFRIILDPNMYNLHRNTGGYIARGPCTDVAEANFYTFIATRIKGLSTPHLQQNLHLGGEMQIFISTSVGAKVTLCDSSWFLSDISQIAFLKLC